MHLSVPLLLIALSSPLVLALPTSYESPSAAPPHPTCGTKPPTTPINETISSEKRLITRNSNSDDRIDIDVYFHVVRCEDNPRENEVPEFLIMEQWNILTSAFQPLNIHLHLQSLTSPIFPAPHCRLTLTAHDFLPLKTSTRQGTYETLNVWFLYADTFRAEFGFATYPQENPDEYLKALDGVVINTAVALPYSSESSLAGGKTLVHEVGHWLNLYHLNHNTTSACLPETDPNSEGDFVHDTPIVWDLQYATCYEPGYDSCPNQPGTDTLRNYMSMAHDDCRDSFTPGQITRMKNSWTAMRAGK